jgi:hypothetical protein
MGEGEGVKDVSDEIEDEDTTQSQFGTPLFFPWEKFHP